MKKITFSLLIVLGLITTGAHAQIQKYTTLAGGALTAFYENDGKYKIREISGTFNPKAAFFFSEHFALGAQLDYQYRNLKTTGKQSSDTSTIAVGKAPFLKVSQFVVGPLMRGYLSNHVFAELTAGLGVVTTLSKSEGVPPTLPPGALLAPAESKHDIYRATLGFGYAKFLNAKVAFEPILRYTFTSEEQDAGGRSNRSGVQVLVGFQYYMFRDQMLLYK